ncbi:uncharacterized protein TM35_000461440 [Trypanosoma theileri]|uniref:Uncharacterized protein n=1 Tax=Trypanosoma theileri TaxID=67003 RepID=A0A1X0NHW6_9TRYP|nr:uncharacterized protein TM35_000461440 [Trypanosoma theileri]ORC84325.1 hypothetical protein TM35_000461440 [Trypanosoma theileri]
MQASHEPCTLAHAGSSSGANIDKNSKNDNNTSFALKVAGWLVPDVRRHLFLLVWVCGIPIHIRYVIHLLRISAVSLDMTTTEETHLQQYRQYQEEEKEKEEENEEVLIPCERALRSAALDILFVLVASDCSAANEKVREMSLPQTEWSEVRSLMYSRVSNHDINRNSTATHIISREATVKGEVLALVPAGDVPLAELQSLYFTALDQARQFEQQYTFDSATPNNRREEVKEKKLSCIAQKQQESRQKTLSEVNTGTDVIVVDSDEGEGALQNEVVVLSDDSDSNSHNNKNPYCKPAKRRRTSTEDIYEMVE